VSGYTCACPPGYGGPDCLSTCPCAGLSEWISTPANPTCQNTTAGMSLVAVGGKASMSVSFTAASGVVNSCASTIRTGVVTTETGTPAQMDACVSLIQQAAINDGRTCNACASSPCLNGGTCTDTTESGYLCACTGGHTGVRCEM
jgi:EGF-like domain